MDNRPGLRPQPDQAMPVLHQQVVHVAELSFLAAALVDSRATGSLDCRADSVARTPISAHTHAIDLADGR